MASYDNIRDVITRNNATPVGGLLHAIEAVVTGQEDQTARQLFPLVLGKNTSATEDMVLCYQYAGYSPQVLERNYSKKNHRCLKVSQLKNKNAADPDPAAQPISFNPQQAFVIAKLKFKDVKRQNCVDEDNVDVYWGAN
jgi:hypothetical protein